jgi:hypothetical protein
MHENLALPVTRVIPTVLFHSDSLAIIWRLASLGRFLVVTQPYTAPHLLVIDTASGKIVQTIGRHGAGPGEFNFPGDIVAFPGSTAGLWVSDPGLLRLTPLRIANNGVVIDTALTVTANLGAKVFGGTPWTDSTFLVSGAYASGRFQVLSQSGTILRTLGAREIVDSSLPIGVALMASQEVLAVDHVHHRIVGAGIMTGEVTIYDSLGVMVARAHTPYAIRPYFRVGT